MRNNALPRQACSFPVLLTDSREVLIGALTLLKSTAHINIVGGVAALWLLLYDVVTCISSVTMTSAYQTIKFCTEKKIQTPELCFNSPYAAHSLHRRLLACCGRLLCHIVQHFIQPAHQSAHFTDSIPYYILQQLI